MLVGLVFLLPAIASRDKGAGDRSDLTRAWEDLVEDHRADADARPQGLRLGHVAEIVVGDLVGEHGHELLVVGLLQEPRGHVELPAARAGRVDFRVVDDGDLDLVERARMVHRLDQGHHGAPDPLGLGGPEGEALPPPDEVSTAHPGSRLSPPTRQTRAVVILSVVRDMVFSWLSAWLANSRPDGVLPRLQRGGNLVLRAVQYLARLGFDTLQRVHGPAADIAGPALEIFADVVAPVPHGKCSGERAQ